MPVPASFTFRYGKYFSKISIKKNGKDLLFAVFLILKRNKATAK